MSSHKPRKKRHVEGVVLNRPRSTIVSSPTGQKEPAFPLAAFLWPARGAVSASSTVTLILLVAFLFRLATGFWDYSGFQAPPMHGDFEAQRHWMEITTQLPITQWYFHDLQWWGLDYPPLTAYHSWLCGLVGMLFDRRWFALHTSRGLDDQLLKVYMRATVLVSEYITYVPAAAIFVRRYSRLYAVSPWDSLIALMAMLLQPATMLVDHGHFQFNTVMLGFLLASMCGLMADSYLWACVFFVASLGFKQMALFYAPAMFCYLLGSCFTPRINIPRLFGIALVTALSFAALFAPLIFGAWYDAYRNIPVSTKGAALPPLLAASPPLLRDEKAWFYPPLLQLTQSIHRIFPFARGLFEDKVANVWCAIHSSGVYKLNNFPAATVQRLALLGTLATIAPPCLVLLLKPKKALIPWGLAATAWGFFLCSYQVHEKNVLLPLLPMTVLLAGEQGLGKSKRAWVGWANVLACWTMFPLLKRDGLQVPYFVLTGLWAYLLGLPPTSLELYKGSGVDWLTTLIHLGGYIAMGAWHMGEASIAPPIGKPDLWFVANAVLGAGGFGICYVWCVWGLATRSGLLSREQKDYVKKEQ